MSELVASIPRENIQRQVRLLVLLDAAESAGIAPLSVERLHNVAYLSDVLSPVWHLEPLAKEVFKRQQGPFYPELQGDLDRLVGIGMAKVEAIRHVRVGPNRMRLDASYSINPDLAMPVLKLLPELPGEYEAMMFIRELLLAMSTLADGDVAEAFTEDATYSNKRIGYRNPISFFEWDELNFSAKAAEKIGSLVPTEASVGTGEKIQLYVRHLRTRLHAAA
jgi:hypothetical protein